MMFLIVVFAVASASASVYSQGFGEPKSVERRNNELPILKDSRLFTVEDLKDSNKHTGDDWQTDSPCHKYARIQATAEKCKTFIQGLTDSTTGDLMWDEHRCTVLTLVYKCHAKVRILSRNSEHVLAEGVDSKELFLELLVDDNHMRVIPLDGMASRELAMMLVTHQQQEGQRKGPDFHVKKQKVLSPQSFGKEGNPSGFEDCA